MQPLFAAMHAIAARRGDGLRPELVSLVDHAKAHRAFGASDIASGIAHRIEPGFAPWARTEGLNVETAAPIALLPHGRKCSLNFCADGTVMITLGTRDYGHGYASPYFASLVVARLGIPFRLIRLYYAGGHPAVKIGFRHLSNIPSRASVGAVNARIGDLIEALCDRAIEKGRLHLSSSLDAPATKIDFDASTGRFFVADKGCHVDILELAKQARDGRRLSLTKAEGQTVDGAVTTG